MPTVTTEITPSGTLYLEKEKFSFSGFINDDPKPAEEPPTAEPDDTDPDRNPEPWRSAKARRDMQQAMRRALADEPTASDDDQPTPSDCRPINPIRRI